MQETKRNMVMNQPQQIRKKVGRTVFDVTLHFSSTNTENPYDKLKRVILNDCINLKKIPE